MSKWDVLQQVEWSLFPNVDLVDFGSVKIKADTTQYVKVKSRVNGKANGEICGNVNTNANAILNADPNADNNGKVSSIP